MSLPLKICGITDPAIIPATAPARWVGIHCWPASPRYVSARVAADLCRMRGSAAGRIAVLRDWDWPAIDRLLAQVPFDGLQLHGAETPEQTAQIRDRSSLPVIKTIRIHQTSDRQAAAYDGAADYILFYPAGGMGMTALHDDDALPLVGLAGWRPSLPWGLAGGITPANIAGRWQAGQCDFIDVCAGIEDRPGQQNPARLQALVAALGAVVDAPDTLRHP